MANEIALGMVKRGASALLIEAPTSGLEVHKVGVTECILSTVWARLAPAYLNLSMSADG